MLLPGPHPYVPRQFVHVPAWNMCSRSNMNVPTPAPPNKLCITSFIKHSSEWRENNDMHVKMQAHRNGVLARCTCTMILPHAWHRCDIISLQARSGKTFTTCHMLTSTWSISAVCCARRSCNSVCAAASLASARSLSTRTSCL